MSLVLGCPVVIRTNISPFKVLHGLDSRPRLTLQLKCLLCSLEAVFVGSMSTKVSSTVSDILRCQRVESREFLRVLSLYRANMLFFVLIRSGCLKIFTFPVVP